MISFWDHHVPRQKHSNYQKAWSWHIYWRNSIEQPCQLRFFLITKLFTCQIPNFAIPTCSFVQQKPSTKRAMAETLGEAIICSWTACFRKAPGTLFLTATRLVHLANAGEETAIHLDGGIEFELTKKKPGFDRALVRLSGPALSGKPVMEFTDEQKWSQLREFSEFMHAREKAKVQVAWYLLGSLDSSYYFSHSHHVHVAPLQDLSGTSLAQQHVQSTHSVFGFCMDFSIFFHFWWSMIRGLQGNLRNTPKR